MDDSLWGGRVKATDNYTGIQPILEDRYSGFLWVKGKEAFRRIQIPEIGFKYAHAIVAHNRFKLQFRLNPF